LFLITVSLYVWLSGLIIKTENIFREITFGIFCLIHFAALYHFCNRAHRFANIVRYQNTLFEHTYGALRLCYCLECK
jgi:hypothetical protein